jgi:dihydropteroate synthase
MGVDAVADCRAELGGVTVGTDLPVVIMGAINLSPESFYAGSVRQGSEQVVDTALAMVEAGAALIDVGARSTAPYLAGDVDEGEERERLVTAVAALAAKLRAPVSADTTRAAVARAALDAGARIINDVSGLRDPAMRRLASERGAPLVLMASPPAGESKAGRAASGANPVATVRALLVEALERARAAGVPDERVVLDPGVGFFREAGLPWHEWDVAVLAHLDALAALGRPLCVGVSRKSFVGHITGHGDPADRLAGSLAATAAAVLGGAAMIRTHDVAATRDAARVAERVRAGRVRP